MIASIFVLMDGTQATEGLKGEKKVKFERQKRTPARGMAGWFMPPAESAVEGLPTLLY